MIGTPAQAAERRATVVRKVYADLMATGAEEAYQMLLAELPRPGASVEAEWAYCGPMLEEDDS
jgi:hypothetical protein